MYQKDYILRMIEMLGELIAAILGLVKKGDYQKASEQLGRIYYNMLKEDAGFFKAIPLERLTDKLLKEHNYTNGHLEILAELFNAEAELDLAQDKRDLSLEFSQKSLLLLDFIEKEEKTYSIDKENKMSLIRNRISLLLSN